MTAHAISRHATETLLTDILLVEREAKKLKSVEEAASELFFSKNTNKRFYPTSRKENAAVRQILTALLGASPGKAQSPDDTASGVTMEERAMLFG